MNAEKANVVKGELAMDRVDIFSPVRCEVTITNNRVTVEVERKPVLRVVRIGKLEVDDQRGPSQAARAHFFACVRTAWHSLPEDTAKLFPGPESLRAYALINTGFTNTRIIPLSTPDQAERVAAMAKSLDPFCIVSVTGSSVFVYTARSQDGESMRPEEFAASKRSVIEYCAYMIGVTTDELSANAGAAA